MLCSGITNVTVKQVGNQSSISLLRQAIIVGSFIKYRILTFQFVSHEILLVRLFCAPSPGATGRLCPRSAVSYATGYGDGEEC